MKINNISKVYNEGKSNQCQALNNINLQFENIGFVFILGKSGSGKSTLLNILSGIDKPSSGEIFDGDTCISDFTQEEMNTYRKNNIGFIFQSYNLIEDLTVKENIKLLPSNIEDSQLNKIMTDLNIIELQDKKAKDLSGGQRQRVSIARALYKNSKIIFADEPTGNLDSENARIVFEMLKKISSERLIIIVTHDNEAAKNYADRILRLSDGKVIEDSKQDTEKKIGLSNETIKDFTLKNKFNYTRKFIFNKKISCCIISLILSITLALSALMQICFQFNFNKVSLDMINANNISAVTIGQGYVDKKTKNFKDNPRLINKDKINELVKLIDYKDKIDYDTIYTLSNLTLPSGGNQFITSSIRQAVITNEGGLQKYNFSLEYGVFPNNSLAPPNTEVAITDYLIYCLYLLNTQKITDILGIDVNSIGTKDTDITNAIIKAVDTTNKLTEATVKELFTDEWRNEITNSTTINKIRQNPGMFLLNQNIDFPVNTFKISGILKTNFFDDYVDMLNMSQENLLKDNRLDAFKYYSGNWYSNFFVDSAFKGKCYKDLLFMKNTVITNLDYAQSLGALPGIKLENNDIYLSANYFREYFNQNFDQAKVGTYSFIFRVRNVLAADIYDVIYEKTFNVVGVINTLGTYNDKIMITNLDNFNKISDSFYINIGVNFKIKDTAVTTKMLKFLKSNDMFYNCVFSQPLYNLSSTMKMYKNVFLIATIVMLVLTILCTMFFFSSIVRKRMREIGIFRALGFSKKAINSIFIIGGLILSFITICLSSIFTVILAICANNNLVNGYINLTNNQALKHLSILNLNVFPFLIIIVLSIFVSLAGLLISAIRINNMKPIDAIKERNA